MKNKSLKSSFYASLTLMVISFVVFKWRSWFLKRRLACKKKEYKDTNGNEKLTIVELTILYLIYSLDFHFYLVFCSKTIDLWMQKIFTMIFFCVKNDSENIYFVGCAMVQFDASLSMD